MVSSLLRELTREGVLRQIDRAFAAFIAQLDPQGGPALEVAAAMLGRMEGMGHSCLPVSELCRADSAVFEWPTEVLQPVGRLWRSLPADLSAWLEVLRASRVVWVAHGEIDQGEPLVLDCTGITPRLYLRRYWDYERIVAREIRARSSVRDRLDEAAVRGWIDLLFTPVATGQTAEGARPAFTQSGEQPGPDWQRIACAIAARGRLALITGGPGTGKTFTAARLIALIAALHGEPERLRIALAAPTGKAAARLRQSIDQSLQTLAYSTIKELDVVRLGRQIGPARTLHALLGASPDTRRFRHHAGNPISADLVIVDEASMVHLEMMAALLQALPASARLVLIGDKDQLASVEAGAVLGDLCRNATVARHDPETVRFIEASTGQRMPRERIFSPPTSVRNAALAANLSLFPDQYPPTPLAAQTVVLEHSHRFAGAIATLARAVNEAADPARITALLETEEPSPVHAPRQATLARLVALAVDGRAGARASYRDYLEQLGRRPAEGDAEAHDRWVHAILEAFDGFRVLCVVREGDWGVSGLNQAIERALAAAGLLTPAGAWYAGRPVMVTRNAPSLGVYNGDVGIALPGVRKSDRLRVYFPHPERVRAVSPGRLAQVETAFATTVHKSQGSEFEHTVLALSAHSGSALTRELLYTGITRARRALTLMFEEPGLVEQGLARATRRESGLSGL